MPGTPSRRLVALVHADVVGSTKLVQRDEAVAHQRMRDAFMRFSQQIEAYGGVTREIRGDALVAEFARASDAVCAAVSFQLANETINDRLSDDVRPRMRVGISLGEVVIADGTVTGAGIVIAQRLEQLAEPGGVVIQGTIVETVPVRLPFAYEDLGERKLKGFDRPVRAFAASLKPGRRLPKPEGRQPASTDTDKPTIAVLPFANMSGDADQEYFSDGITEDIITDLSQLPSVFVIARNSAFTYKGKVAKVADVANDLGVRYVLQGSVRKAGDRVRVTTQLVDSRTDESIWAERYDRKLEDIFSLQDELSEKVVTATMVRLTQGDRDRLVRRHPRSVEAYDVMLRGREQLIRHTLESNARARELLCESIALDPTYATAHAHLAETELQRLQLGWEESADAALDRARGHAQRAVELDPQLGLGHGVLGQIHLWQKNYAEARAAGEKRVALDPNDADGIATLAMTHAFSGEPELALRRIATAMRLDPHYPFWHLHVVASAEMALENYPAAIAALESGIARNPESGPFYMMLAACLALGGDLEAAREALARCRQVFPGLTVAFAAEQIPYRRSKDREQLLEGLRRAGLSDS